MSYLLDTHVLLWWLVDDPTLSDSARRVLTQGKSRVCVSAATLWEIVIKRSLKKIEVPESFAEVVAAQGFDSLPVTWEHATEVGNLPLHHRDPFDRILIAQCRVENLTMISRDAMIHEYNVSVLEG